MDTFEFSGGSAQKISEKAFPKRMGRCIIDMATKKQNWPGTGLTRGCGRYG